MGWGGLKEDIMGKGSGAGTVLDKDTQRAGGGGEGGKDGRKRGRKGGRKREEER